jgi:sugar/nucleoside kinase (ribokinase family)
MYHVTVAGHICLDLLPKLASDIPQPGGLAQAGRLDMRLGGCVANTGLALRALGATTQLVAAIGDDLIGDAITALVDSPTAAGNSLNRLPGRSTSYSIVLEAPGEDRRFLHHVGANEFFIGTDVSVSSSDLLHVGYPQLLPRLVDDHGAGLVELLSRARVADVTTSVDFATVDPQAGAEDWPTIVRRWAPYIDVLTPSIDDLEPVFPDVFSAHPDGDRRTLADALAGALVNAGVGIALVTAGPAGMCLRVANARRLQGGGYLLRGLANDWADHQLWTEPVAVDVIRTTGAGDTATAGFLFALLASFPPEHALRLAAAAAAYHVSGLSRLPLWAPDSLYERGALQIRGLGDPSDPVTANKVDRKAVP